MEAVVVALCGLPGSGKSTLARALQAHTGWVRLDRDALRAKLFATGGYTGADKAILKCAMRERLNLHLLNGRSVILDGMTLSEARERDALASDAKSVGARWSLVWLDCPVHIAQARVGRDSAHLAKDRDRELVFQVAQRFQAPGDAQRLDARESPAALLRQLLSALTP